MEDGRHDMKLGPTSNAYNSGVDTNIFSAKELISVITDTALAAILGLNVYILFPIHDRGFEPRFGRLF